MKIICVAGARPNFPKIAPIMKELKKYPNLFETILVHTGQHYDYKMSEIFFEELNINPPNVYLKVGSGTHAQQTANIMVKFEELVLKEKPDMVLVVGDVNSTAACALVAKKCQVKVAHVEAGLRSFDDSMPEEINRLVTDSIADIFYTPSKDACEQLLIEGHRKENIVFVGNCMIDTLLALLDKIDQSDIDKRLNLLNKQYAVLTLHRPSNVDNPETLINILECVSYLEKIMPVIYPIHPRTLQNISDFNLKSKIDEMTNLILEEPLGYYDFTKLTKYASLVMTDSGGVQEETTVLGVPCLTIRDTTERPITVEEGTNILVGVDKDKIINEINKIIKGDFKKGSVPEYWDGRASERIVSHLASINQNH